MFEEDNDILTNQIKDEIKSASKVSIVVSTIFSVLNLALTIYYAYWAILAIPIAFNPNPGMEGLGLAVAIIMLLITGAAMLVVGLIAILTANRYNKLTYGSSWAQTLKFFNTIAILAAIIVLGVILYTRM